MLPGFLEAPCSPHPSLTGPLISICPCNKLLQSWPTYLFSFWPSRTPNSRLSRHSRLPNGARSSRVSWIPSITLKGVGFKEDAVAQLGAGCPLRPVGNHSPFPGLGAGG